MKKYLLLFVSSIVVFLFGCVMNTTITMTSTVNSTTLYTGDLSNYEESPCKNNPLSSDCYIPSGDLDFITPNPIEYTILEDFNNEVLNQQPMNWLLFSNSEYKRNGVYAKVIDDGFNKYVEMFSDGLQRPLYPQSAPNPTFIFSTKFNLDLARSGIAYADVMIPSENGNSVSVGVSTGAVNVISIIIDTDLSLLVKVGGPFFYYSQNGDGGIYHLTEIKLERDAWYSFRFDWDANTDFISAALVIEDEIIPLYSGKFHVSNRFNGQQNGQIYVPNVLKVTMPYGRSGIAYLDNVIVERRTEQS